MKPIRYLFISALILMSLSCAGMRTEEQRALSGGAAGAGAGALIGGPVGAAVGGVAGGAGGYIYDDIRNE